MSRRPYRSREPGKPSRLRYAAFAAVTVAILGVGIALAAGDLMPRSWTEDRTAEALPVRMSMAGYTPTEIRVRAGREVAIRLWTTDAAPHLQGGVHTFISDELGIYESVPAESSRVFTLRAPTNPGTYDFYCDTCCGGKASPTMHGRLVVEG